MYLLNLAQFWSLALYLQVCQHLPHGLEMFRCVSGTSKEHFVYGALREAEILTSPLPHVFVQLGLVYGCKCSAHWCVNTPSGLKMFLCVTGTSRKCLVHGTIIEAEILTSPLPIYLLNLAKLLGTSTLPTGVSTPPRWSKIVLYVWGTSKKHLVHDALTEAEILTYPLPMYLLNEAQFWSLALYLQVCQHLPHGLEMILHFWETSKEHFVHGALIEAEILTSPLPHVCAQLGLVYGCKCSAHRCVNTPSGLKMFLCVTGTSRKCLVHGAIIEAEILTSPLPIYLLNLAKLLGTSTLPTGVSTPPRISKIFLCVSGTSKKHLVHEALTEAEILTYPLPMYLLNLAQLWSLALYLQVCQHLPHGLEMFLCVSGTSKEHFVYGALREAEILTSPLPMYLLNLAQFWILALCPQLCQYLPGGLKYFYVSQKLLKTFGAWGPNRSWDIDLPHSPCICSTWPSFGYWHSAHSCVNTSQVVYKCFSMCLRNLQKIWYMQAQWEVNTTHFQRCQHLTPRSP